MSVTNASLIMGDSGTGKSSLLATIAEWGWKKYKKVSLLYSTDTGGYPSTADALIRAGIIRVWKMRTRGEAFESCAKACQGYWPAEFTDPLKGETPPGVDLIPRVQTTYTLYCKRCELPVKSSQSRRAFQQSFTCTKCNNRVNLQTGEVVNESTVPEFFQDVGFGLYDGITSMNDWIMADMADKNAAGEIKGETSMGTIRSGDMVFGGSTRNHYGFAQIRSLQWVQEAANVPGLIVGPIFTARKQRATDSYNVKVYGPQIAGQAKTSDVPAWVANCLGSSIFLDEKGRKEWRLYLTEYSEPGDDVIHLCKTRAAPGTMTDYLSDGPMDPNTGKPVSGNPPFTEFNLGHFMNLMETATEKTLKETLAAYPDAPGLNYMDRLKAAAPVEQAPPEEPSVLPKPAAGKPVAKPKPKPVGRPVLKRPVRPGQK